MTPTRTVERTYTHPDPMTSRLAPDAGEVAGAELWLVPVLESVSDASTVTTTTLGVAVVVALPLLDVEVEGVEEVGDGVLFEE
jgi:hypothetical protein